MMKALRVKKNSEVVGKADKQWAQAHWKARAEDGCGFRCLFSLQLHYDKQLLSHPRFKVSRILFLLRNKQMLWCDRSSSCTTPSPPSWPELISNDDSATQIWKSLYKLQDVDVHWCDKSMRCNNIQIWLSVTFTGAKYIINKIRYFIVYIDEGKLRD